MYSNVVNVFISSLIVLIVFPDKLIDLMPEAANWPILFPTSVILLFDKSKHSILRILNKSFGSPDNCLEPNVKWNFFSGKCVHSTSASVAQFGARLGSSSLFLTTRLTGIGGSFDILCTKLYVLLSTFPS